MLKDTGDRVLATVAAGTAAWVLLWILGAPELLQLTAIWVSVGVSHGLSGLLPLQRARATVPDIHNLDTDMPATLEIVPDDASMRTEVLRFALAEPVFDRLALAVETAAWRARTTTPDTTIGFRMGRRSAFASGPWRRDTTVCVELGLLDEERSGELADVLERELRWVRRRLPLWGTIGAAAVLLGLRVAARALVGV